eukprot:6209556-Pleurochrysis_carterae.AAC.8
MAAADASIDAAASSGRSVHARRGGSGGIVREPRFIGGRNGGASSSRASSGRLSTDHHSRSNVLAASCVLGGLLPPLTPPLTPPLAPPSAPTPACAAVAAFVHSCSSAQSRCCAFATAPTSRACSRAKRKPTPGHASAPSATGGGGGVLISNRCAARSMKRSEPVASPTAMLTCNASHQETASLRPVLSSSASLASSLSATGCTADPVWPAEPALARAPLGAGIVSMSPAPVSVSSRSRSRFRCDMRGPKKPDEYDSRRS